MDAYGYNPTTGEYRGTVRANPDQKHPGQYILPGHATFAAPPEPGEREMAVYRDGAWRLVPDWRGEKRYDKADGGEVTFALGEEPDETMTDTPRPTDAYEWTEGGWKIPLETARVLKLAEITAARNAALDSGGAEYRGLHFWTDKGSKSDVLFAIAAYDKTGALEPVWKAKDGLLAIESVDDLIGIATAVGLYVKAQYAREFELIALVQAAESVEDLEAVVWA
jgi:hypothetical protein